MSDVNLDPTNLDTIDWSVLYKRQAKQEFNKATRTVLTTFVDLPQFERLAFFHDFPNLEERGYLANFLELALVDICRDGLCIPYKESKPGYGIMLELRKLGYMRTHHDEATGGNFAFPTDELLKNMQIKFNNPRAFSAAIPDKQSAHPLSGISAIGLFL